MATYYWVGGSGNWDATATTNWAATSGGAGGAGVPSSIDDVVFDNNSNTGTNAFTVTVVGTASAPSVCKDFSTSSLDGAMTLAISANSFLDCYGSITLPATNLTWTGTSPARLSFKSTSTGKTITTNGVTLTGTRIDFDGVGGAWALGSALTSTTGTLNLNAGSFSTANYNLTIPNFASTGDLTRSFNAGSSTITISGTTAISLSGSNLTFNSGTSTLICSAASPVLASDGRTFYDVSFTSSANGTTTIRGINTFNNFSITSRAATGRRALVFENNQTVNGTLTLGSANTAIRRIHVSSESVGVQRTITLNGTLAALADVDFRDIATAGTVGTWTGTRLGNALNNSGITLDAAKTVYRVGTGNWSATQWATSSGGSVNVNNFPLPQDTMIFDSGTTAGTHTIDQIWWLGELNCSALTNAVTIASGTTTPVFYKSIVLDADVTLSGTGTLTLAGQGTTQNITSAGKTFTQGITVNSPNGIINCTDALTTSGTFTITSGTVKLKEGVTTTVNAFATSGTSQKFLQSADPGTQATLSQTSGTVDVSYLTIQDINATGGATFNAFSSNNNADAGNNTGWDFGVALSRAFSRTWARSGDRSYAR